jgi:hypothetical protein
MTPIMPVDIVRRSIVYAPLTEPPPRPAQQP